MTLALRFEPITTREALGDYDTAIASELPADDIVSTDELTSMMIDGTLLCWWIFSTACVHRIGWCALMRHTPIGPGPHLLGYVVFGDAKGQGFGKRIVEEIVARFGDQTITASVRPDNRASERALAACGFNALGVLDGTPYRTWRRVATPGQQQET